MYTDWLVFVVVIIIVIYVLCVCCCCCSMLLLLLLNDVVDQWCWSCVAFLNVVTAFVVFLKVVTSSVVFLNIVNLMSFRMLSTCCLLNILQLYYIVLVCELQRIRFNWNTNEYNYTVLQNVVKRRSN